jgi:subtilisin family serine protease
VDALHAWTMPGGRGKGVNIIHIEFAWNQNHEDLVQFMGGVLGGQTDDFCSRQHGTAVLGILGGDTGDTGVTGICPEAFVRAMAVASELDANLVELPVMIHHAANALRRSDIILVELQHAGPETHFRANEARHGYIPAEWWPATFDAVKFATTKGIIVVEAAGNGESNLDADIYDAGDHFPPTWKNPFRRATDESDSGSILVGAGAPPAEPHGKGIKPAEDHGPERSRLKVSNFGSVVDVQAWGREVTTCGYGSLQGGMREENRWYTDDFGGTSSAGPIVAGVLACVQGVLRAKGASPLTPAEARKLLRSTGWAQADRPGALATKQPIGRRPDLKQLIQAVL